MDTPTPNSLPALRTYARDLETERARRGLAPAPVSDEPTTPTPPLSTAPIVVPSRVVAARPKTLPPPQEVEERPRTVTPRAVVRDDPPEERAASAQEALTEHLSAMPTVVLPFHELRKGITTVNRSPSPPSESRVVIEEDDSAGTIITDTKKSGLSFFARVREGLRKWRKRRREAKIAKTATTKVVPAAETRRDIIQRATSQTGREVTEDESDLRGEIQRRVDPPPEEELHTTWTPNTESVFPLLPGTSTTGFSNVQVTTRPRRGLSPTPRWESEEDESETSPVVEEVEKTPPAPAPAPTPEPEPEPVAVYVEEPPVSPPVATPVPVEYVREEVTPEPIPVTSAVEEEALPEPEIAPVEFPPRRYAAAEPARSWRTFFTTSHIAAAIVIVIIIGTATFYLLPLWQGDTEPALTNTSNGLLNVPQGVVALSVLERDALMNALTAADTGESTTELSVTTPTGALVAPSLLTLLDRGIDQNLAQTATAIAFGWYEGRTPFVVVRVSDARAALGGMLRWETTLPSALSPFIVSEPTARQSWRDVTLDGRDLRLFSNDDEVTTMVYGFANDTTIVITTNQATFAALRALVVSTETPYTTDI